MKILALDVGGTAIKSAIIDDQNALSDIRLTPSNSAQDPLHIQTAIRVAAGYSGYDVLSVSMTGQINDRTQTLCFEYFAKDGQGLICQPVGALFRKEFHCPVFILNDSNAAALGEAHLGAGRGHEDFLCLTYGTGVGGAIIQGGKLYTGRSGIAGEVGHLVTHAGGRLCGCGHRGCYEQYASTTALLCGARKLRPDLENARQLFDAAAQDPGLRRVIHTWEREIVEGLCSLTYIFNPGCIVLGGGVMEREDVLEQIRKKFRRRIIPSFANVEILPAQLGNQAGMFGAAVYARQRLEEEKSEV